MEKGFCHYGACKNETEFNKKTKKAFTYCEKCRVIKNNYINKTKQNDLFICKKNGCYEKCLINIKTNKPYYYCDEHRIEHNNKYMNGQSENQKKRYKKYRKSVRNKFLNMYGNKCVCCGDKHKPFLQLDHVRGNGKESRICSITGKSKNPYTSYIEAIKWHNPSEYQILCVNCNFNKNNGKKCDCNSRVIRFKKISVSRINFKKNINQI